MEFIDGNNGLWGLFISALISSTLLPGGSEVLLALLARQGEHAPWLLLTIATFGNTLGALITFLTGVLISVGFLSRRPSTARQQKSMGQLRRWGTPLLLLSWLPLVGDVLCLAAGLLRLPWPMVLFFIALGKGLRYYAIILLS